jgi:CRP-like cAMP-binding protein
MNNTLANIYQHTAFTSSELEIIFKAHEKTFLKKGDMFLKEGQLANEYYCLESGLVRSYAINSEGNEITTGFFGKDEIVIEVASLFLRTPTKENIQALTDCECWKIDFNSFETLFQTVNGFMDWGRTWMSGALLLTKQRSLSMITDSATERYLALQKQHPEIILNTPLKYIASYLGITDTSLSRIRKEIANNEKM